MSKGTLRNARTALQEAIDSLELDGGDRFDAVRFRFIKSMAEKAAGQDATVAGIVSVKAAAALDAYRNDLEREREQIAAVLDEAGARHPSALAELQGLQEAGAYPALRRLVARLNRPAATSPLAPLLAHLGQSRLADSDGPLQGPASELLQQQENAVLSALATENGGGLTPPGPTLAELKSARYFRELSQRSAAQRQVERAVQEAPEDSGPLNPEKLAIRSLMTMRELSPGYLGRFVSYVDTLFWLERAGSNDK